MIEADTPKLDAAVLAERLTEALASAHIAGCEDVHEVWSEDAYPEFGEAASDYAAGCDFTAEILALVRQRDKETDIVPRDVAESWKARADNLTEERDNLLRDISDMMACHVDNWPAPRQVKTALTLIDKTLATLVQQRDNRSDWLAGEVDVDGNPLEVIRSDELQKLRGEHEALRHNLDLADDEIARQRDKVRGLVETPTLESVWRQARSNHFDHSATESIEQDIRFFALALAGEAGEVANFVKKRWRDGVGHDDDLRKERADVFAYNIMLADALGMTPADLMAMVAFKQQMFVEKMATLAAFKDTPGAT